MRTTRTALAALCLVAVGAAPASTTSTAAQPAAGRDGGRCTQPGPYELPHGSDPVTLDPADFTTRIDHPYWPMRPGTVWRYVESDGEDTQRVTVRVTRRTRTIAGIRARVVHDVVHEGGEVVEDTRDWFAQDSGGTLWYLGEHTEEYEGGELVSTEGSWEHGVDGAQAGVILPARPRAGCAFREEFKAGEAVDRARILSRTESMDTPTGLHRHLLHTANLNPLEPGLLENKFYARGVGPVLEVDLSPGWSRGELVRVTRR
jgi:hypothetical protein